VHDVERLGADLHRLIDAHVELAHRERDAGPARHGRLKAGLTQMVLAEGERQRWPLDREQLERLFDLDIELNAQGLGVWLDEQSNSTS
jgi:hydroxyacylglutathione hydrolase